MSTRFRSRWVVIRCSTLLLEKHSKACACCENMTVKSHLYCAPPGNTLNLYTIEFRENYVSCAKVYGYRYFVIIEEFKWTLWKILQKYMLRRNKTQLVPCRLNFHFILLKHVHLYLIHAWHQILWIWFSFWYIYMIILCKLTLNMENMVIY